MKNYQIKYLCKFLISTNRDLIEKTAIKNCHCVGLNSFIINEKPRIRLFIADDDCEMYNKFNYEDPIIPIHPHKYDDVFFTIEGELHQHLYSENLPKDYGMYSRIVSLQKYEYNRLSDNQMQLKSMGSANIYYNAISINDVSLLKSNTLHTASIKKTDGREDKKCSWVIIETFEDKDFKSIGYTNNINKLAGKQYYLPFENPIEYLNNYFESLSKIKLKL